MKVRINATGDTIVMTFLRPNPDTKLEGYILGYGSSMFSKQFIQLPENGQPYETEFDAEPKYLIAVQPIPTNEVKKQCTGKVELQKPLHLVLGSDLLFYLHVLFLLCLRLRHYTVRYRERNRKWNYQTCPTSDTVIDNLRPNTVYEFGVQPNSKDGTGVWSKPVIHNISGGIEGMSDVGFSYDIFTHTTTKTILLLWLLQIGKNMKERLASFLSDFPCIWYLFVTVTTFIFITSLFLPPTADGAHHRGNALPKPVVWSREKPEADKESECRPKQVLGWPVVEDRKSFQGLLAHQTNPNSFLLFRYSATRFDINENSSIFRPLPASEVDIMGKKRFVAPHVIYKTDKKPDEPCSITSSLSYFPDEEGSDQNVTGPPRIPPSNLTVVTVEGCPSFVILDWQKSDNETREYEVVSTTKGPNGEEVSVLTTNQTHTAVENLKPESSYEFTVTPKNELGTGPSSDPVSFSTESADPRVSEHVSGKDAIWTQFPFKSDDYSECNGKQYVKRTWYRKFVGIQLCNSLRYKIYLSDSLNGKFYNIGDQTGHGEDHCQFVDSFLDGRTGTQMLADQLPSRPGFYRAMRQEPVNFGEIGGKSHVTYVGWYECGTPIPGKW
uniref:ABI family, member 3 (NESH) binding protein a n=1 Tax=Sander lucioperca TaxID=283035 RepID=A0A8C9Y5R9_SANLU